MKREEKEGKERDEKKLEEASRNPQFFCQSNSFHIKTSINRQVIEVFLATSLTTGLSSCVW